MATVQQVLDVARGELGTAEASDGSTKYHRAYGLPFDQPWCAVWIWWIFRQAGAAELLHPKTAYTPTLIDWFKSRGRVTSEPRVGDLVFFNWRNGTREWPLPQHVGIVEAAEPTSIVTIEGNTSLTNQGNGGAVMRRRRARNNLIVGYAHPAYGAASAVGVAHRTQRAVHVTVDGIWGPGTDKAVTLVRLAAYMDQRDDIPALQRAVGTDDDGIWGPASKTALTATVRALQAAWGTGADGIWGAGTDKAWAAARAQYGRGLTSPQPVAAPAPPPPVNPDPVPAEPGEVVDLESEFDVEQLARTLAPLVVRELVEYFRSLPPAA